MAARYDAYGGYDQDQRRPPFPPQAYQGGPSHAPPGPNGGRNHWQPPAPAGARGNPGAPPYSGTYSQYALPQQPHVPMPPPPASGGPGPVRHQPAHARAAPYARPPQPPPPQQQQHSQYMDHSRPPQYGNQQSQEGYEPRGPSGPPLPVPHQDYPQNSYPPPQPPYENNNRNTQQVPPPVHSQPPPAYGHSQGPPPGPDYNRGPDAPYQRGTPRQASPPTHNRGGRQMSPPENDREAAKIEKRIAKERPCRILFIRNVKYNVDGGILKSKFAEMGEMKSFFDLISSRGLVFVTYHDLRTAIAAREGLQGFEVQGRPIDIHYSLPRDEDNPKRKCDREKNQGTIRVVLKDSPAPIREQELERMFGGFGDIKGMYFSGGNPSTERLVEFFDTRATCEAYDRMQNAPYPSGGQVELFFDWDVKDIPISHPPAGPRPANPNRNGPENRVRESMPPPTPVSAASSNYERRPQGPPQQNYQADSRPPYQQNADRPPYQHNQPPHDYRQPAVPHHVPPPPLPSHHFNGQPPTPVSSVPSQPPTARDQRDYDRPPYGNQAPPTPSYAPGNNGPSPPPGVRYGAQGTSRYQPGANAHMPLGQQPNSPIPAPAGQAGSPPPAPPANLSNLLASLGNLPPTGSPSGPATSSNYASNTQRPPFQGSRDSPYTPADPYGRPGDPDRLAKYSAPPPPNNYRPVPPSELPTAPPQQGSAPPLPPPGMLAQLGQRRGGPASGNNAPPAFSMPPAPSYGQPQHEYTPSAPASSVSQADQPNTQVSALLAMLSSQQR